MIPSRSLVLPEHPGATPAGRNASYLGGHSEWSPFKKIHKRYDPKGPRILVVLWF